MCGVSWADSGSVDLSVGSFDNALTLGGQPCDLLKLGFGVAMLQCKRKYDSKTPS